MIRNSTLFLRVVKKRKEGWSYSKIHKELGIAKSTLSVWFSRKRWSTQVKKRLMHSYKKENTNRLIRMNKQRHLKKLARYERYRKEAQVEYRKLKSDHLFIAGLSLYWGEGEKTDNGRVSVINSDPEMIRIVSRFYRSALKIPDNKLRAGIFLYNDIDQQEALTFWSRKIHIPRSQFIKTQLLPSRSKLTKRKTTYGMCSAYFSSTEKSVKIREWIRLLATDMRV